MFPLLPFMAKLFFRHNLNHIDSVKTTFPFEDNIYVDRKLLKYILIKNKFKYFSYILMYISLPRFYISYQRNLDNISSFKAINSHWWYINPTLSIIIEISICLYIHKSIRCQLTDNLLYKTKKFIYTYFFGLWGFLFCFVLFN